MINDHLSHFIAREHQDKYYFYRQRAFENRLPHTLEVQLVKQTGERIYVRLESKMAHTSEDQLLVAVIDITKERELQPLLIEQREQQRQKIAQYIHDGTVQALAAINFALRGIIQIPNW